MSKENKEAKKFSEELDRLIAGEEIRTEVKTNDDMRQALDFARKMQSIGRDPSPEFQSRLKEQLVRRIVEQEARGRVPTKLRWWEGIMHQAAWQAVTAILVIVIVVGVVWGSGFFERAANPVTERYSTQSNITSTTTTVATTIPSTTTAGPFLAQTAATATATAPKVGAGTMAGEGVSDQALVLKATGSTDRTTYSAGDIITITVQLQNVTPAAIELTQSPILSLMQAATGQPVYTFAAVKQTGTIEPGGILSYQWQWNQIDERGGLVSPGYYYLELEDLDYQGYTVRLPVANVQFEILPAN